MGETSYRLKGARRLIEDILDNYRRIIYEYNSKISGTGYYLKPVHIVYKKMGGKKRAYYYYGKYWWILEVKGKRRGTVVLKWRYYGSRMPWELADNPPPETPFDGISYAVEGDDVIITEENYRKLMKALDTLGIKVDLEPVEEA